MSKSRTPTARVLRALPRLLLVTCSVLALPVLADNGRFEINQDCALAGCFPGDSPGFPITISASGSYLLVSNIEVDLLNANGIDIYANTADVVDIDLNGFTLSGGGSCTGVPVTSCSGGVGFRGVIINQSVASDSVLVSIRNGTVRGFIQSGLGLFGAPQTAALAPGSKVERVTVTENGGDGISYQLYDESILLLDHVQAIRNGSRGIGLVNNGAGQIEARHVVAYGNQGVGLVATTGSMVTRSRFQRNGGSGLSCQPCTVALGDVLFGGNGASSQYFITTVRNMGGVVCLEASCP